MCGLREIETVAEAQGPLLAKVMVLDEFIDYPWSSQLTSRAILTGRRQTADLLVVRVCFKRDREEVLVVCAIFVF